MTRVTWDAPGQRLFHTGVDRGMLYVTNGPVVTWNGLVSVTETEANASPNPYYLDGQKLLNIAGGADFQATIEAFAAPLEFMNCIGRIQLAAGLFATDQPKNGFGFSFRTRIGNDVAAQNYAYKIHVVYNAIAANSDYAYSTDAASPSVKSYTWNVSTVPVAVPGYRPSAHFVIDSRLVSSDLLSGMESILYGSDSSDPRMPTLDEIATAMVS